MTPSPKPERKEETSSRPPIALPNGTGLREEYRVEEVLGMGSFGITYRCVDEHLDTAVAIKEYYPRQIAGRTGASLTVRPHSAEVTEDFKYGLKQFMEEGRTIARFDHPNVVDVHSYFEENGTGYLVMEYYEGHSLAEHLVENGGQLPEGEAVELIQDVLEGLEVVHEAGVLHRDVDPQNIYRTAEGEAILIDFGAAREAMGTRSESLDVILKPGYAPIEQYSASGDQGPHTDIYACAATLYKCLTGLKPQESTERVQEDRLAPPHEIREEVSLEMSLAVMKGLAIRPGQRPASAGKFSALLEEELGAEEAGGNSDQARRSVSRQGDTAPRPQSDRSTRVAPEMAEDRSDLQSDNLHTDNRSGWSGWSTGLLPLVGAALIGGTLLLSETEPIEVLAFFGTWVAVCFGLVGLFREGEKVMSYESRAAVGDWLLREDFAERPSNWPETFTSLFDAVFTNDHLSWTCARRSALVSIAVMAVLSASMIGFGVTNIHTRLAEKGAIELMRATDLIPVLDFPARLAGSNPMLAALIVIGLATTANIAVDFVSLYETRWIIGKMARLEGMAARLLYLAVDLVLTTAIFVGVLFLVSTTGRSIAHGPSRALATSFSWKPWAELLLRPGHPVFLFGGETHLTIMFYSTLFTSVWAWLYAAAGLALRAVMPLLRGIDWVKHRLDLQAHPVHAMGVLLAGIASVGFAVSAPFVL